MSDDLFDAPDLFAAAPAPPPAPPPPAQPAKPPRPRRETTRPAEPHEIPQFLKDPADRRDPRMRPNPGHCPEEAIGKRVIVELANGETHGVEPVTATSANGWAASPTKGGPGANWTIRKGWPWSIAYWRLA